MLAKYMAITLQNHLMNLSSKDKFLKKFKTITLLENIDFPLNYNKLIRHQWATPLFKNCILMYTFSQYSSCAEDTDCIVRLINKIFFYYFNKYMLMHLITLHSYCIVTCSSC